MLLNETKGRIEQDHNRDHHRVLLVSDHQGKERGKKQQDDQKAFELGKKQGCTRARLRFGKLVGPELRQPPPGFLVGKAFSSGSEPLKSFFDLSRPQRRSVRRACNQWLVGTALGGTEVDRHEIPG